MGISVPTKGRAQLKLLLRSYSKQKVGGFESSFADQRHLAQHEPGKLWQEKEVSDIISGG